MRDEIIAKAEIERRRRNAEKEYEEKSEKLEKNEVFSDAYARVSYLKFEFARRKVYGLPIEDELLEEFREKSDIVAEAQKKIGIINDEPDYFCKKCSDTGVFDGKICECFEKARVDAVLDEYPFLRGLPEKLRDINFDFYGDEKENYAKRVKFLNNCFLKGDLNFCTLTGAPGSGKTYISYVAIKEALLSGKSVKVINAVRLNKEFLEYHCASIEAKNALWEEIAGYDYLLIDDLGVESALKNVTAQYLYELLAERMEKKTLINGNLSVKNIEEKYGQRIFSRLSDKTKSAVIEFSGGDYRLRG